MCLREDFPDFQVELVLFLEFLGDQDGDLLEEPVLVFDQHLAVLLQIAQNQEGQVFDLVLVQPHVRNTIHQKAGLNQDQKRDSRRFPDAGRGRSGGRPGRTAERWPRATGSDPAAGDDGRIGEIDRPAVPDEARPSAVRTTSGRSRRSASSGRRNRSGRPAATAGFDLLERSGVFEAECARRRSGRGGRDGRRSRGRAQVVGQGRGYRFRPSRRPRNRDRADRKRRRTNRSIRTGDGRRSTATPLRA